MFGKIKFFNVEFDNIKLLYVLLFFSIIFLFNLVVVNEEFYVSIGLFLFIFFLLFITSDAVFAFQDEALLAYHAQYIVLLHGYYKFLTKLLVFFSHELIQWGSANEYLRVSHRTKIENIRAFLCNVINRKFFIKVQFTYFFEKFLTVYYYTLLSNMDSFLKAHFLFMIFKEGYFVDTSDTIIRAIRRQHNQYVYNLFLQTNRLV